MKNRSNIQIPTSQDLDELNENKFNIQDNDEIDAFVTRHRKRNYLFIKINKKTTKKNCVFIDFKHTVYSDFKKQSDQIYKEATEKLINTEDCYELEHLPGSFDKYEFKQINCDKCK